MREKMKKRCLTVAKLASRALLAGVFLTACIHKLADPAGFALQVATYQILPLGLINLQAIILPWLELFCALLLLLGFLTRPAALVTCGMNIMFIVAIGLALEAGLQLQCGCFSAPGMGEQLDHTLIIRDAGLLLVGLFLTLTQPDGLTLDHLLERRRDV
jgi:putative oxidoreductase